MAVTLEGLLGNPAFQSGMGLLSAGSNRNINPWAAGQQGLMGAKGFQVSQEQLDFKRKQQAALIKAQDQMKLITNPQSYQVPGLLVGQEDPFAGIPAPMRSAMQG